MTSYIGNKPADSPISANDVPDLPASKITSGTIDSNRIAGLPTSAITSGTFADSLISASSVSQHATSFDDNKIINDLSALAIRQASDSNRSAYNTQSQFVDVFQDDTGIGTETNTDRNDDEFVSSGILGSPTKIDQTNPTQSGGGTTQYQFLTVNSQGYPTSYTNMATSGTDYSRRFDWEYAIANGGYPIYTRTMGITSYTQYDYKEVKTWSGNMALGKAPTHGDLNQGKIQYSVDGVTYTDVDLSGASVSGSNPQYSGSGYTGGALSNFASDGTWNFSAFSGAGSVVQAIVGLLQGIPTFKARYFRYYAMSKHSYTDVGYAIFTPYYLPLTINATGSMESNVITAPSTVSSMGAIITYQDNIGVNALNTDIVLKLSADGTNYETATLQAMPDFSTGIKMAKVNDLSISNTGTNLKYKLEFANQSAGVKEARVRGVSLQF